MWKGFKALAALAIAALAIFSFDVTASFAFVASTFAPHSTALTSTAVVSTFTFALLSLVAATVSSSRSRRLLRHFAPVSSDDTIDSNQRGIATLRFKPNIRLA